MFSPDSTDSDLIRHAVLMWRNHLQTGNVVMSTQDAVASGQESECRMLNSDQMEFVLRLEQLADKFGDEFYG